MSTNRKRDPKPDLSLEELFQLARNNAARIFREEGEIVPIWHAVTPEGPDMLIATPWQNDDEKEVAVEFLRDKFREQHVQMYAFVVEAWVVEKSEEGNLLHGPRPSEHPDRREILRITAEDDQGRVLSGHFYILRPEHRPPTLSPFRADPPDMLAAGRMSGLLQGTQH